MVEAVAVVEYDYHLLDSFDDNIKDIIDENWKEGNPTAEEKQKALDLIKAVVKEFPSSNGSKEIVLYKFLETLAKTKQNIKLILNCFKFVLVLDEDITQSKIGLKHQVSRREAVTTCTLLTKYFDIPPRKKKAFSVAQSIYKSLLKDVAARHKREQEEQQANGL